MEKFLRAKILKLKIQFARTGADACCRVLFKNSIPKSKMDKNFMSKMPNDEKVSGNFDAFMHPSLYSSFDK